MDTTQHLQSGDPAGIDAAVPDSGGSLLADLEACDPAAAPEIAERLATALTADLDATAPSAGVTSAPEQRSAGFAAQPGSAH